MSGQSNAMPPACGACIHLTDLERRIELRARTFDMLDARLKTVEMRVGLRDRPEDWRKPLESQPACPVKADDVPGSCWSLESVRRNLQSLADSFSEADIAPNVVFCQMSAGFLRAAVAYLDDLGVILEAGKPAPAGEHCIAPDLARRELADVASEYAALRSKVNALAQRAAKMKTMPKLAFGCDEGGLLEICSAREAASRKREETEHLLDDLKALGQAEGKPGD